MHNSFLVLLRDGVSKKNTANWTLASFCASDIKRQGYHALCLMGPELCGVS